MDSQDPTSWQYALAYALRICKDSSGSLSKIVLVTHTKQQLSRTSLSGHIGDAQAKILHKGNPLTLSSGVTLTHHTMRTLSSVQRGTVAIVFYGEDGILDFVDGIIGLGGVVVVPELDGYAAGWTERWNPIVHGTPAAAPSVLIADKIVTKALTQLSGFVNLSHGVMTPRDKEHSDDTLRILRANGHSLDPKQLKSWAIKNGWQIGAAEELAALAVKIWALKGKPNLSKIHNPAGRYEGWLEG